jgi:ABC-type polysaccharide/polyol phosphate export permease
VPDAPSSDPIADRWVELEPARGLLRGLSLREVLAYRGVAFALARRDLQAGYKQTVLGMVWLVLSPLASVVVFTLVFGELAGLPSQGIPFPVFVLAGMLLWNYVSWVLGDGAESLVADREMIQKIYYPRILSPAARAITPAIELGVQLALLVVLMAVYGVAPGPQILLAPLVLLVLPVLGVGFSLGFAALNARVRDVSFGVPFLLGLLFYAAPIVYAEDAVDGWIRVLLSLNPMTGVIDAFRWAMLDAPAPPAIDLLGIPTAGVAIAVSLVFFQRAERRIADVV